MKSIAHAVVLLVCAGVSVPALSFKVSADDWSGIDKQQHFSGSFYLGAAATQLIRPLADDPVNAVLLGTLLGQMPGLLRETAQGFHYQGFSYKDHAYNLLGAFLGALLQGQTLSITSQGNELMGSGVVIALRWKF